MDHIYWQVEYYVMHWADRLRPQEWLLILAVAIIVGAICLRGFGSRKKF